VLGLSAYFVDLMYFVEKFVLDRPENFRNRPNHALHLRTRRPDLWDLDLCCANATEVVAYLDVINEVLEKHLLHRTGMPATGDVWESIADRNPHFGLPFHWPLERIETYLGHFNKRRLDATVACRADEQARTRAWLRVSETEYQMITKPAAANFSQLTGAEQAFLSELFAGMSVFANGTVATSGFGVVFVWQLLKATGASREQLGQLLASAYVRGTTTLRLRAGRSGPTSIQNDTEIVEGLRAEHLDRLHRLYRLARRLPWSILELDAVLTRLTTQGLVAGLDDAALRCLGRLGGLQERLGMSVTELTGLWSDLPNDATQGVPGLFERLFNPPEFSGQGRPIAYQANPNAFFLHPSFNTAPPPTTGTSSPQDNTLARLLSGLRVNDQELVQLLTALGRPLGVNPTSTVIDDRRLRLSIRNLTLLYRHAMLARQLQRSIPELVQLLDLVGIRHQVGNEVAAYVEQWSLAGSVLQDDLSPLLEADEWIKRAPFSLPEIVFITGRPVRETDELPNAAAIAARVTELLQRERAFELADTVLSGMPNGTLPLTEEQSRQIIQLNKALFDVAQAGAALRLKATVTPEPSAAAIRIPQAPDITVTAAAVAERLAAYSIRRLLPGYLAPALGVPAPKLKALLRASGQGATLDSAPFLQSVGSLAHGTARDQTPLVQLVGKVLPYALLYRDDLYDASTIEFIRLHPGGFGQSAGLSTEAVRLAAQFQHLMAGPDPAYVTSAIAPDQAAVREVVDQGVAAATSAALARALRTDPARIEALRPHLLGQLPANPLDALAMLAQCLELIELLGISGETLKDLALTAPSPPPPETEYQRLRRAADGLFAAFRVKYQADAEFRRKVEPWEDKLRSRRRDGLVAYLRFIDPAAFGEPSDLYHYFLLDVDLEGCARTTRVAAAIFSLQLYVHRVLMQLERTRSQDLTVSSRAIPREEWAWRRHYRLWEANRRVFLYPESYLVPTLRDDKTPLFKELEDTLLQQDVTEDNVRNAFAGYLSDFDQLAKLRVAGACTQTVELAGGGSRDTLHLIGVASADPPAFHYQSIEDLHRAATAGDPGYGAWRPINVSIPARTCGAVVYRGTLYLFWVEIVTQPKTAIENGTSRFQGYRHKATLKYTSLALDGRWTAPQRLQIVTQQAGAVNSAIVIDDPLLPFAIPAVGGGSGVIELPAAGTGGTSAAASAGTTSSSTTLSYPTVTHDRLKRDHRQPIDDYTLTGTAWDTPYPIIGSDGTLRLAYGGYSYTVNLFEQKATQLPQVSPEGPEFSATGLLLVRDAAGAVRGIGRGGFSLTPAVNRYYGGAAALRDGIQDANKPLLLQPSGPMELVAINGDPDACIVRIGEQLFYAGSRSNGATLWTCRLGSTAEDHDPQRQRPPRAIGETLFSGNIESLLSISHQQRLSERSAPFTLPGGGTTPATALDYRAAPGRHYREIFAHIPWLIAHHLRGQARFAAAQRWLHVVFNPAAENVPPASPEFKRVWQFREFRQEQIKTLREALEDQRALEVYRRDPFSPHAIARLRPGAYERAVVMHYVDNLLDWGDSLFAQFTAESIGEATMLYTLAADILGPRALDVGDCGEAMPAKTPKTYNSLAGSLRAGHEFLIEAENQWLGGRLTRPRGTLAVGTLESTGVVAVMRSAATASGGEAETPRGAAEPAAAFAGLSQPVDWQRPSPGMWTTTTATPLGELELAARIDQGNGQGFLDIPGGAGPIGLKPDPLNPPQVGPPGMAHGLVQFDRVQPGFVLRDILLDDIVQKPVDTHPKPNVEPWKLLDTSIAFCIPDNRELRSYWDRVADRLYRIRNCMDISGARRMPELFGPEIDPRLLVKMKAAGLSLEDVLTVTSGSVPPYRFTYLLEKARQYAGTVQGFGAALLSALEKRDAETLSQLRVVHEQHLLKLRTRLAELEISTAEQTLAGLRAQKQMQEYRHEYYTTLSHTGLTTWERTQQVSQHSANGLTVTAALLSGSAGVLSLLPQLGAVTAMTYGGHQLSDSVRGWAAMARDSAGMAQLVASSAGIEANFQRRDDEWKHQATLAQREIDQLDRQIAAAEIRLEMAERSLEVHNETIAQTEEIFQFYRDRFTTPELYTSLSNRLRRLYRDAFNAAFSMATMVERAYHFERPEDTETTLPRGQWDPATGGLLAGERLLLDLQALECRYLETDQRRMEIEQSFSLAQFDSVALVALREQGECTFTVPELFFDLAYPGHYRRRLRAVRVSVPCVVGPFTNVSATLRLVDSRIRLSPDSGPVTVPSRHAVSIATSSGQNDAGVFEFNFRDERYMPFEGGGAVSTWQLSLPKAFPLFDYETIADLILHISYTALDDQGLRAEVEAVTGNLQRSTLRWLRDNDLQLLVSMRRDLPDTFARLLHSPPKTAVPFEIDRRRLPWFIGERPLTVREARVLLRTSRREQPPTLGLLLNGGEVGKFTADPRSSVVTDSAGNLEYSLFTSENVAASVGTWFRRSHTVSIADVGNLSATANPEFTIDPATVLDVLFEVRYRVG